MKPTDEEDRIDDDIDDTDRDKIPSTDGLTEVPHSGDYPDQSNSNKENEIVDDEGDDDDDDDDQDDDDNVTHGENHDMLSPTSTNKKTKYNNGRTENDLLRFADSIRVEEEKETDPVVLAQIELIDKATPTTDLEIALSDAMKRKTTHLNRLTAEIVKLKNFISKRKQTYKRKRKDDGAPTRALSAYNIFIQERFAMLAKENEMALKSESEDVTIQRVPPAHLVAATGNVWKTLPIEEKQKYEERAKGDRERYEKQMAEYQPPDKQSNRKRNKTGYNMFFSSHVLRMKQTDNGVPSERGSVARLVGSAWKLLAPEEKAYYESEADKHNGMNPVKEIDDEDDDDEGIKRPHHIDYQMQGPPPSYAEMHMHGGIVPPSQIHAAMAVQQQQHIPDAVRHHNPYYPPPPPPHHHAPHMYAPPPPPTHPPYGHYDYSQHHQRHQARAQGAAYQQHGYQPNSSRRPYEG